MRTEKLTRQLIYVLYNAVILIAELWIGIQYDYCNISLIIYFMSYFVFGNLVIWNIYRENRIISLFSAFNGFGILYTNFYILQMISVNEKIPQNNYYTMLLSYLAMLVFDIVYLLTKTRICFKRGKYEAKKSTTLIFLLSLFFLFSIGIEFYVIFYRIGITPYLSASRAQKSLLLSKFSALTFYKVTIPLVSVMALQQYFKYKSRFCAGLAFFAFVISIFNALISMSRAELISIMLPYIFLFEQYGKLNKKKIIFLVGGSFFLFGAWKSLFSSGKTFLYFDSEFNTWYEIFDNVIEAEVPRLNGKSYADTLLNLIVPFTNAEPLSVWYVKTFEYTTWLRGGGRGFSGVLEAYMNFSIWGVVVVYGFYGWLLKQTQLNLEKDDDRAIIIYMILLISMFQFFRSESYSLWKNMAWFRLYPVVIIMWVSRRIRIIR